LRKTQSFQKEETNLHGNIQTDIQGYLVTALGMKGLAQPLLSLHERERERERMIYSFLALAAYKTMKSEKRYHATRLQHNASFYCFLIFHRICFMHCGAFSLTGKRFSLFKLHFSLSPSLFLFVR